MGALDDTDLSNIKPNFEFGKFGINEFNSSSKENEDLFTVMTANHWLDQAKNKPIPRMLFGELWFEGEFCILFADTNLGKSLLAVQIANSISSGNQIAGFKFEAMKQLVLYFDFELSDKQFEIRYSNNSENHYSFHDNLIRIEMNPDAILPDNKTFEEYLYFSVEKTIAETGAKILIIDNLTYLKNETEKAKHALPLMKYLKSLKSKFGLSILSLAHTPKRDLSKPITRNDLQGSKMLINFCDSSFSIGESHTDTNLRYLKQIKSRNTDIIYHSENVAVCQIEKPDNFLQFDFMHFGKEQSYLKQQTNEEAETIIRQVMELHEKDLSYRRIATELGISHTKVSRIVKKCNKL